MIGGTNYKIGQSLLGLPLHRSYTAVPQFSEDYSFAPLLDHVPYGLMQGRRALGELVALRKALEASMNRAAPPQLGRDPREVHRLHADIVEAVLSGDAERAREVVRQHYVGIEERVSEPSRRIPDL